MRIQHFCRICKVILLLAVSVLAVNCEDSDSKRGKDGSTYLDRLGDGSSGKIEDVILELPLDAGTRADGDLCTNDCADQSWICGDGVVQENEQCDVGGREDDIACIDCIVQPGWSCSNEPSECTLVGCRPQVGTYSIDVIPGRSSGTCELSTQWGETVDIGKAENTQGNTQCEGTESISEDGCTISWEARCPLTGDVGGYSQQVASLTTISNANDQMRGTITTSHNRSDNTSCTITDTLTLSRIDSLNGEACWENGDCISNNCCRSDDIISVLGICRAQNECQKVLGMKCEEDWQCQSNNCYTFVDNTGICVICTPGQSSCDENYVTTCSDDGQGYIDELQDCSASEQACVDGKCVPIICQSKENYCLENIIYSCGENGTESVIVENCWDSVCLENDDGTAICKEPICPSAGDPVCISLQESAICGSDRLGYSDIVDCGDQVCKNGECIDAVCEVNAQYCEDGNVVRCSPDRLSTFVIDYCESTEFCDDKTDTPQCLPQICTPNQPSCDGDRATSCNTDGSGYTESGTDCTLKAQLCHGGECVDALCEAGVLFCEDRDVVRCNDDRLTTTTIDDCTDSEYCGYDAGQPECLLQICVPNQPLCKGYIATTCNAEGSGYSSSTGVDCTVTDEVCALGVCGEFEFIDNFEDGDYDGWTISGLSGSSSYTHSVTETTAADGTLRSLSLSGGNGTHKNGLYYIFDQDITPAYISYWIRPDRSSTANTYFVVSASESTTDIIFIYFNGSVIRNYTITSNGLDVVCPIDTWCHIELRNIDWIYHTYDYYVDDVLIGAKASFRNRAVSSMSRLDLYHYFNSTGYWDQIIIR